MVFSLNDVRVGGAKHAADQGLGSECPPCCLGRAAQETYRNRAPTDQSASVTRPSDSTALRWLFQTSPDGRHEAECDSPHRDDVFLPEAQSDGVGAPITEAFRPAEAR